jgi:hypothetical protein
MGEFKNLPATEVCDVYIVRGVYTLSVWLIEAS